MLDVKDHLLNRAALFLVVLFLSLTAHAGGDVQFPPQLSFDEQGVTHELVLTGEAERVVLIFRVYDIAHYTEQSHYYDLSPETVISDGPSKAIVINFARKLSQNQIRDEFDKSLRKNAEPEWLEAAGPTIDRFVNAIDRDAKEGDQLVFYWLEGGQVYTDFNGERAFEVSDEAFAKLVWSIWFGAEPACDREELLARSATAIADD
ncbi:MAG: chalcone isomerase family protein [Pseudomonadota bacterium]